MRPQKQKYRHRPEEGMIGDCHRTAIACVLDLDRDEVPHFGEVHWQEPEKFHEAFERWLENRGLTTVWLAYDGAQPLQQVLDCVGTPNPTLYWLLGGRSRNGVGHTVVCRGREIAWDPSLDGSGIVGPCEDDAYPRGLWYVTVIAPARTKGLPEPRYRNAGSWTPDGRKFTTYRDESLDGRAMYVLEEG